MATGKRVEFVDFGQRYVIVSVDEGLRRVPITNMLNALAEETDDYHECSSFVCGEDGIGWWAVRREDLEAIHIQ